MAYKVIGKRVIRKDQLTKCTGTAVYNIDVVKPNTLYCQMVGSPHAYAKVINIDTSAAEALPGVRAVFTSKDSDIVNFKSRNIYDEPYLAVDRVLYPGQPVAAVAAETREVAEEAAKLVKVTYETLNPVFDPREADKAGAPEFHPGFNATRPDLVKNEPPSSYDAITGRKGDEIVKDSSAVDQAKQDSVYTAQIDFEISAESHFRPENNNCIAWWEGPDLTVYSTTQGAHGTANALAGAFGIGYNQVTSKVAWMGGGFGGRGDTSLNVACAALAKKTGRPVRGHSTSSRAQAVNSHSLGPHYYNVSAGLASDGHPTFMETNMYIANGAWSDAGYASCYVTSEAALAVYKYDSVFVNNRVRWVNRNMSGARRSYGGMEGMTCSEMLINELLEKADLDPAEWRKKWGQVGGDPCVLRHMWGELAGGNFPKLTEIAMEKFDWKNRWKGWRVPTLISGSKRRGLGIACGMHVTGVLGDKGVVRINVDGTAEVITQAGESGQGIKSAICQCVGEVLGLPFEKVRCSESTSDFTPVSPGTWASRGTPIVIGAAVKAAEDCRKQVFAAAAPQLGVTVDDLYLDEGKVIVKGDTSKFKTLAAIANGVSGIYGHAREFTPKTNTKTGKSRWEKSNVVGIIEVEVDVDTGVVDTVDIVMAGDCGNMINPTAVEQQLDGAIIFGHSWGMHGGLIYDDANGGIVVNASPLDYRVTTIAEVGSWVCAPHSDPADAPTTPLNVKGLGEGAVIPIAPAIGTAIYNACGARLRVHPFTAKRVLEALEKA